MDFGTASCTNFTWGQGKLSSHNRTSLGLTQDDGRVGDTVLDLKLHTVPNPSEPTQKAAFGPHSCTNYTSVRAAAPDARPTHVPLPANRTHLTLDQGSIS